jgi:hypothetical protein
VNENNRAEYGRGTVSAEWAHGTCEYCGVGGPAREVLDGTAPPFAAYIERHPIACKDCVACTRAEAVAERAFWHAYKHTYSPMFRERYERP